MHEASVVATELAHNILRVAKQPWVRITVACVIVVLVLLFIAYRYSPKTSYTSCAFRVSKSTVDRETQGDAHRLDTCVRLEQAPTNSARTLGLSGRKSMDRSQGMLFDFGTSGEYCMWMKDMNFGLDMVWLDEQKEIVYMIEGVTPDTYPKSFCGPESARYVVEVNSGIVKAANLHVGQRLKF